MFEQLTISYDRLISLGSRLLGTVGSFLIFVIMCIVIGDVLTRAITGSGVASLIEYAEVLLVGVVFLSLPYARRTRQHVTVDAVVSRLPYNFARIVEYAGLLIAIIFLTALAWSSVEAAISSTLAGEYRMGVERIPIWPARIAVALGWCALLLELVADLLRVRVLAGKPT